MGEGVLALGEALVIGQIRYTSIMVLKLRTILKNNFNKSYSYRPYDVHTQCTVKKELATQ